MIKIVADTTSGIPVAKAKEMGIIYIPQVIMFGEKSYFDDNELNTETFLQMLVKSKTLPQTAAPPPSLYNPVFKEFGGQGNTIFVICPSTKQSGTARSATIAAQEFPESDIRVIDSMVIGAGLANLVIKAKEWVDAGWDANCIEKELNDLASREKNYFIVDTLEFLHKGGRIGGAKALVGGLLQVKPILGIRNGQAEPIESQRTHRRALMRLKELVLAECPKGKDSLLSIMHGDAEDVAGKLAQEFAELFELPEVPVYELTPAFLVHAGPGVLGVSFFTKKADYDE